MMQHKQHNLKYEPQVKAAEKAEREAYSKGLQILATE